MYTERYLYLLCSGTTKRLSIFSGTVWISDVSLRNKYFFYLYDSINVLKYSFWLCQHRNVSQFVWIFYVTLLYKDTWIACKHLEYILPSILYNEVLSDKRGVRIFPPYGKRPWKYVMCAYSSPGFKGIPCQYSRLTLNVLQLITWLHKDMVNIFSYRILIGCCWQFCFVIHVKLKMCVPLDIQPKFKIQGNSI